MTRFLNPNALIFAGALIAAIGAYLSALKQSGLNERLHNKNDEIIKLNQYIRDSIMGGDSFCYLLPIESTNPYAMLLHSGEYPLYDIGVSVLDLDQMENVKDFTLENVLGNQRNVAIGNLAAHSSMLMGRDILPLTGNAKRFTIQITARNGFFHEALRMRRGEDGVWHHALRVTRTTAGGKSEVIFTKISEHYPKEADGSIDWH